MMALIGRVGDGVLGPFDDAADVYEDWEPACEPFDEAMELSRGEEVPDEYAWLGRGRGRDGNLSILIKDARRVADDLVARGFGGTPACASEVGRTSSYQGLIQP